MFIKSFITIFIALFYVFILQTRITVERDTPIQMKIQITIINWVFQAIIGANIVVFLYHIWS